MKHSEFNDWYDYHRQAFPGLSGWIETNPGQRSVWEKSLTSVPKEVAKCATDELVTDEVASRAYSDHCKYIRSFWSRKQSTTTGTKLWGPQVKDDTLVARCSRCMDTGYVSVVGPKTLKNAWRYDPVTDTPRFTVQPMAMACDCAAGRVISEGHRKNMKRPIAQWVEGAEQRHPLFVYDSQIVNQACVNVLEMEDGDVIREQHRILHGLLNAFNSVKSQSPYVFPGYEGF